MAASGEDTCGAWSPPGNVCACISGGGGCIVASPGAEATGRTAPMPFIGMLGVTPCMGGDCPGLALPAFSISRGGVNLSALFGPSSCSAARLAALGTPSTPTLPTYMSGLDPAPMFGGLNEDTLVLVGRSSTSGGKVPSRPSTPLLRPRSRNTLVISASRSWTT